MTSKNDFQNSLKNLEYAKLTEDQNTELRNVERTFNNQNNTSYYFMVMKKD